MPDIQIQDAQDECSDAILRHCGVRVKRYITSLRELLDFVGIGNRSSYPGEYPRYRTSDCHHESKEDVKYLGTYCTDTHVEYMQMSYQRLTDIVELVHRICCSENQQSMTSLASLTYRVRQSSSFRLLLEFLSQNRYNHASKMVEKVGKISKFYRSAVTIVRVAATFCSDVSSLKVVSLVSQKWPIGVLSSRIPADLMSRVPPASRWRLQNQAKAAQRLLKRWRYYVVHAEMQLLLFYDTQPEIHLAHNYIGISKRSCYLCATFIRLHGHFIMEGAHQQLYCLWTIPPMIAFRDTTRESHFAKTLSGLYENVEAKVKSMSARSYSQYPLHGESIANFSRASLLSNGRLTETRISKVPPVFSTVRSTLDTSLRDGPGTFILQRPSDECKTEISPSDTDVLPSEGELAEATQWNGASVPKKQLPAIVELGSINFVQVRTSAFEEHVTPERRDFSELPPPAEHSSHTSASTTEGKSTRHEELPSDPRFYNDVKEHAQGSKSDSIRSIVKGHLKENEATVLNDTVPRRRRKNRVKTDPSRDQDRRRRYKTITRNVQKHRQLDKNSLAKTEWRRKSRRARRRRHKSEDSKRVSREPHREVDTALLTPGKNRVLMPYRNAGRRRRRSKLTVETGQDAGCLDIIITFQNALGAFFRGLTACF
jgi:OTT_1508-like deaminase